MKLTGKERRALRMLRELDSQQRDHILDEMHRHVLANRITARVSGRRRVRTVPDKKIEGAFGKAPPWRPKVAKGRGGPQGATG